MRKEKSKAAASKIFKFILFALIFICISAVLYLLWQLPEERPTSAEADSLRPVIIIDAGHGGIDGGTSGLSAVPEKTLNLDIALTLNDILTASGFKVVMTRTDDVMLTDPESNSNKRKNQDLSARLKIAKKEENAIFVSIHMNSFPIAKYNGLQVYYSENNPESLKLAVSIQDTVKSYLQPSNDRKVKSSEGNIFLLDNLNCPSVLIECGFLSNPQEAKNLNDAEYRRRIALLICASISNIYPS